jgi:ADP-ribosyl-[dinitrogen reductase] hydrolase
MVRSLFQGFSLARAYKNAIDQTRVRYAKPPFAKECGHFERLFSGELSNLPETAIQSGGYVLHTLEASMWCLLNTGSFQEAVLTAVNLGEDTDTTGCVTGGLARVRYGLEEIPKEWLDAIVRRKDIESLFKEFVVGHNKPPSS